MRRALDRRLLASARVALAAHLGGGAARASSLASRPPPPAHARIRALQEATRSAHARGDYEGAAAAATSAVDAIRAELGAAHPALASALNNLALARKNLGDVTTAVSLYRCAAAHRAARARLARALALSRARAHTIQARVLTTFLPIPWIDPARPAPPAASA
jgi:predicted O-linked N-acetylglucosamine transferase (SPINDLY family)